MHYQLHIGLNILNITTFVLYLVIITTLNLKKNISYFKFIKKLKQETNKIQYGMILHNLDL